VTPMPLAPFLSLDGIDGTGKSTQCRLLAEWLFANGVANRLCADPGGTALGDQLRSILLTSRTTMSPRAEALIFMASRAELVSEIIRPALESGQVVICDRFVTANVVYQGHAGGLSPLDLWAVGGFCTDHLFPDRTFILDLPVEVAAKRRGRTADRMESRGPDYLDRVRRGFLAEAARQPDRYVVIDASPDVTTLQSELRRHVTEYLSARGIAIAGSP
jgi:dTMP kinase